MKLAGRYLTAAQQLGDATILSPLRHRQVHRATGNLTYSNIQELAAEARNELQREMKEGYIKQQFITPKLLRETASDIIARVETMHDDMVGIEIPNDIANINWRRS